MADECGVTEEMYARVQAELAACRTERDAALWSMREAGAEADLANDKLSLAEARLTAIREALT